MTLGIVAGLQQVPPTRARHAAHGHMCVVARGTLPLQVCTGSGKVVVEEGYDLGEHGVFCTPPNPIVEIFWKLGNAPGPGVAAGAEVRRGGEGVGGAGCAGAHAAHAGRLVQRRLQRRILLRAQGRMLSTTYPP